MLNQPCPCSQASDPDLFFDPARVDEALAIGADCPLKEQHAELARQNGEEYGVWGEYVAPETAEAVLDHKFEQAMRLIDGGASSRAVARELNTYRKRIDRWVRNRDETGTRHSAAALKKRQESEARYELIRSLRADGMTWRSIEADTGMSQETIQRALGTAHEHHAA